MRNEDINLNSLNQPESQKDREKVEQLREQGKRIFESAYDGDGSDLIYDAFNSTALVIHVDKIQHNKYNYVIMKQTTGIRDYFVFKTLDEVIEKKDEMHQQGRDETDAEYYILMNNL